MEMLEILVVCAIALALLLLVIYYILLVRAILEMLRRNVNPILLTFAFGSLIPIPPFIVLGVLILIIWNSHKKNPRTQ
jgi:hypothetical protein